MRGDEQTDQRCNKSQGNSKCAVRSAQWIHARAGKQSCEHDSCYDKRIARGQVGRHPAKLKGADSRYDREEYSEHVRTGDERENDERHTDGGRDYPEAKHE